VSENALARSVPRIITEDTAEQRPVPYEPTSPTGAESQKMLEAPGLAEKKRSKASMASSTGSQSARNGREISETFSNKIYEMKWCLSAIVVNALLLSFVNSLSTGILVDVSQKTVGTYGGVLYVIVLLFSNIMTIRAMDNGFAAFFGNLLSSTGSSMAVCGFAQISSYRKLGYAGELSLNSSIRKTLVRLSYFWIVIELMKLLTPLPATALLNEVVRTDFGTTNCIEFTQDGVPVDRSWPTLEVESGVAELIFGSSIGVLRSEVTDPLPATTAVIGPQLLGAVGDGDTIVGNGFVADIVTECQCSPGPNIEDLRKVGVPVEFLNATVTLASKHSESNEIVGISVITKGSDSMNVTLVLVNSPVCGGYKMLTYPVCKTKFDNHRYGTIEMQYMTDGTPASIAQEVVRAREVEQNADIENWMYTAMLNLYGSQVSAMKLPGTVPGMMNPLLYWTSSDLVAINVALVEAGLETFFTIILRAAIQRSYTTKGATCVRNIVVEDQSMMSSLSYGIQSGLALLIIQQILCTLSAFAFIPWLINSSPATPAIRAVKENAYFTTLLADSNFSENIRGLCNAPTFAIWQALDATVKVGESVESMEEDVGHIVMEKPKLVRPLVNGRKYM
jgi:hypothetical protein